VSHLIPVVSTKSDRAIRFGRELERAMKAREVGRRAVAQAVHASDTSVMYWRTGRILPRIVTAEKLAEALEWPRLAALAAELRRKTCLVCGTEFVDDSGSDNRRYCTLSCRSVRGKSLVGTDRRTRAAMAERRLLAHQRAVAAYCAGCEPSGRCMTPGCALRPVSPLPLFLEERPLIAAVKPSPHNGHREPGQQSAILKGVWALYSPEARAARIATAAAGSRRARGLEEVPA
jgi:DNA-binding XRE family transcriptional regulator